MFDVQSISLKDYSHCRLRSAQFVVFPSMHQSSSLGSVALLLVRPRDSVLQTFFEHRPIDSRTTEPNCSRNQPGETGHPCPLATALGGGGDMSAPIRPRRNFCSTSLARNNACSAALTAASRVSGVSVPTTALAPPELFRAAFSARRSAPTILCLCLTGV